ncbi:MAG TPA: MFS transporter [Bryobacteraceae bacterium]|nr:MFS transporter [Bryobacteraceae bacterium]
MSERALRPWAFSFGAVIIAMMAIQMSSLGFSPLLPAIQKDFHLSYSQIGLFTGLYGLVAMAMSVPAGILAKRIGEKRALAGGLLGVALGLFLLSQASTYGSALGARIVWLLGYRVAFVCVMIAIALVSPGEFRSTAMGILGAMASLASVIGAPFGTTIGGPLGWRGGIVGFAIMALLGACVFWLGYSPGTGGAESATHSHSPAAHSSSAHSPATPTASAFRSPVVWSMVLLGLINMGGFSATFFVPSAVKTTFQLGAMESAYVISASYVVAIFANLLFGYLCDRFDRWDMMIALALLLVPACFAMMAPNLLVFRVATALVISLGLCATNQIFALAGDIVERTEVGPVMGVVSLGGGLFGYVGPQVLGILRDRTGGFTAGWYFVAAGVLVSLIEIVFLRRYARTRPVLALSASRN